MNPLFAWGHNYDSELCSAVNGARPNWLPTYYHKAETVGLGFNRSSTGSNTMSQYASSLKDQFDALSTCPEYLILCFHHVPWDL